MGTCAWVCVHNHGTYIVVRGKLVESQFQSIKHRSSGVVSSTLTHWTLALASTPSPATERARQGLQRRLGFLLGLLVCFTNWRCLSLRPITIFTVRWYCTSWAHLQGKAGPRSENKQQHCGKSHKHNAQWKKLDTQQWITQTSIHIEIQREGQLWLSG